MSIAGLLSEIAARNIELHVEEGKLHYKAPEGALTAELRRRISTHKDEILAHVTGQMQQEPEIWLTDPSSAQERLWFFNQVQGPNFVYNIPLSLRMRGKLDKAALRQSVCDLVHRHHSLRSSFVHDTEKLRLKITRDIALPWLERDISGENKESRRLLVQQCANEIARHCFDLSLAPLMTATLLVVAPEEHILFMNFHHIVVDGWSIGIMVQEISAGYEAHHAGRPFLLNPLKWQYTDYIAWQAELAQTGAMDRDLDFWQQKLAGVPACITMPADFNRSPVQNFTGSSIPLVIDLVTTTHLRARARQWGASLNHLTLAATVILFADCSGSSDLVIGMPLANRNRRDLEPVVGMFVNVVPLRFTVSPDMLLSDLVADVIRANSEALSHCNLPFDRLVKAMITEKELSITPLFQVAYDFLPPLESRFSFGGMEVEALDLVGDHAISKYDCTFYFDEKNGALAGQIEFNSTLYRPETVERWAEAYKTILTAMLDTPDASLKSIPLIASKEMEMVDLWSRGTVVPLLDESPWARFENVALERPDKVAVENMDVCFSYRELARRAEIISAKLAELSIKKGDRVGLMLPRTEDYLAAMLGVTRRGAVFVPFDLSHPADRLKTMAIQAGLDAVISYAGNEVAEVLAPAIVQIGPVTWSECPTLPDAIHLCHEDPLYMIFTSGSTGIPKAVNIPWRGLCNLVQFSIRNFSLSPDDRISEIASLAFDASIFEIWPSLLAGAAIVFVPDDVRLDPRVLGDWLIEHHISVHFSPTPLAEELLSLEWPATTTLRLMSTGGQRLHSYPPPNLPFSVMNLYGPTEYSVFSTWCKLEPRAGESGLPPIGAVIDNTRIAVLDHAGRRTLPGNAGELYLSGMGIALEYFGSPEATACSFVTLPGEGETLWYRTGDNVRLLHGGTLEFIGRIDGQIKLRGHRIEPGEIEHALMSVEGVTQSAVRFEDDHIVAYVEKGVSELSSQQLRMAVAALLPAYMIPSHVVMLESLPRQSSGKIDLKSIPFFKPGSSITITAESLPKKGSAFEADVARAWAAVLERPVSSVKENFFDLGGHSMLLVRLKDQILKESGKEIAILDLLRYPTIAEQALFLDHGSLPQDAPKKPSQHQFSDGIAIIGMAGRFPKAENVEMFWENLLNGRDCISRFSPEELLAGGVPPELFESPDYVPANGILQDFDRFDADFFGVSAREAEVMDPQQRLLLEEAWHTFEDAGLDPERIDSRVGVFVGSSMNTYLFENVLPHSEVMEALGGFAVMISNDKDFASTRLSYKLGLRGPSISVNTGCSTSLVAIHQAVTAIRDGQCELALAGGACVRSRQIDGYRYEIEGILSKDGKCRTFDSEATGMVGGNGVALVLLKPLQKAVADCDHIYAVIKGIAVNNDGSSKIGYTAPSISGQSLVIRDALQRAGVEPQTVLYTEAHGTATQLGDSIEVAALAENYAAGDTRKLPMLLGSVKTNIGHLDTASGAAGFIKTALCLFKHTLVPSLHFKNPNPEIQWPANNSFQVSRESCAWKGNGTPLRAAVSSFGIGGTNAHAVLEEAPLRMSDPDLTSGTPRLLLFSGKNEHALQANASVFSEWLKLHDGVSMRDVAHTLAFGRRHFESRGALCGSTPLEAGELLSEPILTVDRAESVAFMFPGMGAQKPGMGLALYSRAPKFKACIDLCADILLPILGLDIRSLLLASPDERNAAAQLDHHRIGQPAVFAFEYALAQFWIDLGFVPSVLIGHSLGEWVAACVAGVFTLPDALQLVTLRGGLMEAQQKGAMLAVSMSEAELALRLPECLDIATVNAFDQIVVAGPAEEIEKYAKQLKTEQVQCKLLHVSLAAHSSLMQPALEPLRLAIASVARRPPTPGIAIVSNVTGRYLEPDQLQSPDYWTEHLRKCVRFADGLARLWERPGLALLECGPSHTLSGIALRDARRTDNRAIVSSFEGNAEPDAEWRRILESAGTLWSAGLPVDLEKLFALQGSEGQRIPLPGYAFQPRRYWLNAPSITTSSFHEEIEDDDDQQPLLSNLTPAEGRVIAIMQQLLGPVALGRHRDFFLCGGNSLMAVRLASNIRAAFGIPLTPRQIMQERTPAKIAAILDAGGGQTPENGITDLCLVLLARGDDRLPPIVLVHAVGGGIFFYSELVKALATKHPVYALQAVGLWDESPPVEGIPGQAQHYYSSLLKAGIYKPVVLAGSSYGGLVCYELDRLYQISGHKVPLVALFDSPGPGHMPERIETEAEICAWMLSLDMPERDYASDLARMQKLNHEERVALLMDQIRKKMMPHATARDVQSLLRVFSQNLANMQNWNPEPHDAKILFFKAEEQRELLAQNPELAWASLAIGGLDILLSPGDHSSMLSSPHVNFIAKEINRRLSILTQLT